MLIVLLSLGLVVVLLHLASLSVHDVEIVLANVSTLICGGVQGLMSISLVDGVRPGQLPGPY